ncbi:MAG TPA: hypothetical protein VLD63_06350 [Anaerolineales bacterium]|nr:hypothetical protein [Anaerolineales bacterium]
MPRPATRPLGTRPLKAKPIPVYSTPGDWVALLVFPYIFSPQGEWIGWVTSDRQVYDVDGVYVGWVTSEPRILRKRTYELELDRQPPPPNPGRIRPPGTVPLPPMMASLPFEVVDVMEEDPDRLHTLDHGELKEDVD